MNKTKTAVEWLQEALSLHLTNEQKFQFEGLFQQALGMEDEQEEKAYSEGYNFGKYGEDQDRS
jgi:hypothetical protein